MRAKLWERPAWQGRGKPALYDLVCCAAEPLDLSRGSPVARGGWCPCDDLPETVDIEVDGAPWSSPWGQWIQRSWSVDALDPALGEQLGRMSTAYWVTVRAYDEPHLEALQAAWATVRWLVELGAFAVYDAAAMRWWSAEQVAAWGEHRPLSLPREVHRETWLSDQHAYVTTHGLVKFGRPDVWLHVPRELPEPLAGQLRQLLDSVVHRLAAGEQLAPGDVVDNGFVRGQLVAWRPDVVELGFEPEPDTLVLLPVDGRGPRA